MGPSSFARSRRSLAEPPSNGSIPIYEDIDQFHHHPPMITPISGVPNLKVKKKAVPLSLKTAINSFLTLLQGKAVIRPIAFRPTPSNSSTNLSGVGGNLSGTSTPTNAPMPAFRPLGATVMGPYGSRSGTWSSNGGYVGVNSEGFAPGHPLARDGRRHYGSEYHFLRGH